MTENDLLEHGRLLSEGELCQAARQARDEAGLSQREAARRLGVAQATLAQAEGAPKRSLIRLRCRMITTFGAGLEVQGPYYVVKSRAWRFRGGEYFR